MWFWLNSWVQSSTAFWISVKTHLFLFRRCEESVSIFATSLYTSCCKVLQRVHMQNMLISCRRKKWHLCQISSKSNLPKSTDIMMQETHWFYSLISLRYSASIVLIENLKILWMIKCSMNSTWLHNFSLKPIPTLHHHFLLNHAFSQILIMHSTSHTFLWLSVPQLFPWDSSD